jgi:hypothetical protein
MNRAHTPALEGRWLFENRVDGLLVFPAASIASWGPAIADPDRKTPSGADGASYYHLPGDVSQISARRPRAAEMTEAPRMPSLTESEARR